MIEREVKLAAPPGFRLLDLGAVADDVVVTAGEERTLLSTYLDTADLRLARWGCTLRHRAGEGWTLKLPDAGHDGVLERPEITVDAPPGTPPSALVDLVRAYVRSAPLREVARMRTVRRSLLLMSHDGRRLAEIDDDEVSVLENRRVAARFREVEVEAADGAPDALIAAVVERLRAVGAGRPDPTPKLYRVLGDRVGVAEVCVHDLGRDASAGAVARRAIAASVLRLLTHDTGVRLGGDPEDVHQARVATRRLRSDLRTFAPLLDQAWSEGLRERLTEVAADLGAVRDAEVLRDRLAATASRLPEAERAAATPILRSLDSEAAAAREVLLTAMRTPEYVNLLDDLVDAAQEPVLAAPASRPAAEVLPGLVRAPWAKLRRARRRLSRPPSDPELHALRIRAKRARYAAEAVAPVIGRRADRAARAAAALQGELGELHDAVVASDWLRAHGRGRRAFAGGALLGLETAAAEAARVRWRVAWRKIDRMDTTTWT